MTINIKHKNILTKNNNSKSGHQVGGKVDEKIKALQLKITELESQNSKLKRTNHLKDEFVSIATHQIRGPLGAMKGYISLILEGDYGNLPKEFTEPLNIIFKSADTLAKTVNDFLDVSRIEQGEMKYYMKDFDMRDLILEVVSELKGDIKKAKLELRLKITDNPCVVNDDKTKIKQVLVNLIDNAIKYTKTGWIEIDLEIKDHKKVLFSVKDSGVGISSKTLPLLFRKFSRSNDAGKNNILGTGLGLYIAKKMIQAQKGKIWAESKGEGKGSQFYVELSLI